MPNSGLAAFKAKPVSQLPETGGYAKNFDILTQFHARFPGFRVLVHFLSNVRSAGAPPRSNEGERRARGGGGISGLEERSNFLPVELTRLMPEKPKQPAALRFRSWRK